jgi:type VI secretion system secreted protein VgrG
MAKMSTTSILINGTEVKQFYQFSLSQGIFAHHVFRLTCPAEALDGAKAELFATTRNFIGSDITVQISSAVSGAQPLQFKGVVTQVEAVRGNGYKGDIIVSGFSPTIAMDNGPHCNSWEKKAVKNIATDVLSHFASVLPGPQVQPSYGQTLSYTVQYKETAWQFLCRLAATYGEWLIYDGQKVCMGPLKPKTAKLVYGSNLSNFSMALQARPGSFTQLARDYVNDTTYNAVPTGIESLAGLNDIGKHVYNKSKSFYSNSPKDYNNTFLTNKKQLEDITNIRAAAQSSNMVRCNGTSTHFGVQLGNTLEVSDSFGAFTVIEVTHHCDGQGNYSNEFIGIPSSVRIPPVTQYAEPFSETQCAVVTDNHDPKGLGRVRVRFYWQNPDKKTPWLRVSSPHGGGGKGMFFIPEVGEEVIVGFEGNSPTKAYVDGTVYHGKANSTHSNAGNDVKALQTRSGNKVVMNDAAGSVFVEDKDGNSMMYDGAGNITVKANKKIHLVCGSASITMLEDGTIDIVGKDVTSIGSASVNAISGGESSNSGITIDPTSINASAVQKILVGSGTELSMQSTETTISGTATTNVTGGVVNVN